MRNHLPRQQHGITLVEALLAFVVLSLGLMAAVRLQTGMRLHADVAQQRSEAVRLAQQDMEALRGYSDAAAYAQIADEHTPIHGSRARFDLVHAVQGAETLALKSTQVSVNWADRAGDTQTVSLRSHIGGTLPAYSAVLSLPPQDRAIVLPKGVPAEARWLGHEQRVIKPSPGSQTALRISAATGQVTAVCDGIDPTKPTRALNDADLTHCAAITGQLLSGYIRFALGQQPDAVQANDAPLPLNLTVMLDHMTVPDQPRCESAAMKTVRYTSAGAVHTEAVPMGALPASVGASSWVDLQERFVTYSCLITLSSAQQAWSGSLAVVPEGWALGTTAGSYKVCRYSADPNAAPSSGYAEVRQALSQQNYLVVRGELPCPAGVQPHNGGPVATVAHQP